MKIVGTRSNGRSIDFPTSPSPLDLATGKQRVLRSRNTERLDRIFAETFSIFGLCKRHYTEISIGFYCSRIGAYSPRLAPFLSIVARTRAIPATLRHSGDDLVHARSSGKRLIIIRRSSIERCLAASLSRCDRFGPIDSSLVPIPAHLRIILLSDDFAIGCFHRPRHGISFLFFFFECRTSNRLTYFDRSCMFELRVCKSI